VETYLKNIQKISSNNEMIYIIPHHKNIIEEERKKITCVKKMVIKFMQKLLFRHKK